MTFYKFYDKWFANNLWKICDIFMVHLHGLLASQVLPLEWKQQVVCFWLKYTLWMLIYWFCIPRLSGLSTLVQNAEWMLSCSNYSITPLNNVSFKHLEYAWIARGNAKWSSTRKSEKLYLPAN